MGVKSGSCASVAFPHITCELAGLLRPQAARLGQVPPSDRETCHVPETTRRIFVMLAVSSLFASAWSAGPAPTRRDVLIAGFGAGAAALALPAPVLAQRSALIPKQSAEATANFKAFQLSNPGEETEAFKAAEKRRIAGANGAIGTMPKEETAEQTMARLGMKSYSDSLASGKPDPCAEGSFACGRKK